MHISAFFHHLNTAYHAEIDDLRTDSDGRNVLAKRLREKRQEMGFLLQMLEISPEMVAVVLHQAFRFVRPGVWAHVLAQDADELPDWDSVSDAVQIEPWAQTLVQTIAQEPRGPWFLTLAAALEYLYAHPRMRHDSTDAERGASGDAADAPDSADSARSRRNRNEDHDRNDDDGDLDDDALRADEEAGNDWLADQGFDRKD